MYILKELFAFAAKFAVLNQVRIILRTLRLTNRFFCDIIMLNKQYRGNG